MTCVLTVCPDSVVVVDASYGGPVVVRSRARSAGESRRGRRQRHIKPFTLHLRSRSGQSRRWWRDKAMVRQPCRRVEGFSGEMATAKVGDRWGRRGDNERRTRARLAPPRPPSVLPWRSASTLTCWRACRWTGGVTWGASRWSTERGKGGGREVGKGRLLLGGRCLGKEAEGGRTGSNSSSTSVSSTHDAPH